MSINLAFTYPKELEKAKKENWPFLIPIGTMEYHSAHCPFGCDSLVSIGIADRIAEKIDAVVLPPVWYGVASYAVAGPEKGSIHVDCDTFEAYIYCVLKSLFRAGIHKNIYFIISHQTEDYNPMELACMKAARKLIFEYLEENDGYGWWGNNENKDFYENLKGIDNPWNWVRCLSGSKTVSPEFYKKYPGDHAGKYECGGLEYLYPGTIKLERLKETDDWFAQNAVEMDVEKAKEKIEALTDEFIKLMK